MTSFRKNDTVKLNDSTCFTFEQGGGRTYPLSNYECDEQGIVNGHRSPTAEETEVWYASDASKGMTDDGETKLPPMSVTVPLHCCETFTVVRGRSRLTCCWGNPRSGYVTIRTIDGEECFVKRELLTHA